MNRMIARFAMALAASTFLLPAAGMAQDSARLLTQAADSFELIDEAMAAAATLSEVDSSGEGQSSGARADRAPDEVELAALYYYAEQKQDARVEAESARLKAKYPSFEVPADLNDPASARAVDESSLWALYEQNDFTGIDAEIIRRQSERPDWQPSEDFASKLARKKQRVLMTEAVKASDWNAVVQAAAGIDVKTEKEVDLLWSLIDAYAQTGMKEPLADVYRGILLREGEDRFEDEILVTTLRKAIRDFPSAEVQAVMNKLADTPQMQILFQPVSFDLLRKTVAEFNADITRTDALPEDSIAQLKAATQAKPEVADLALLGWYYLKIKQPAISTDWFRRALELSTDVENAKGLYLSLAAQNFEEEAYQVAAKYLESLSGDPEFLMNALSLRFAKPDLAVIDEKIVTSYSTTILQTLNPDHAEILGWYAYNSKQYEASEAWFGKAIDWKVAPARVKGLALSYLRLSAREEFAALKGQYGEVYPEIWDEIEAAAPPRGKKAAPVIKPTVAVEANYFRNFKAKKFSACIADVKELRARGQASANVELIGGWCYLGLGRLTEAREAFGDALKVGGQVRADGAYGLALTLLRGRLTDDAEALLGMYPLNAARDREVRAEIYVQRARSAFDRKLYQRTLDALNARASLVAEPADLSQLRGWAHYHLGNKSTANQVFKRLNSHMQDAGARRGLAETSGL